MLVAVFHGIYRVGSVVKNPAANAGNVGLIPGSGWSLDSAFEGGAVVDPRSVDTKSLF